MTVVTSEDLHLNWRWQTKQGCANILPLYLLSMSAQAITPLFRILILITGEGTLL